MLFQAVLRLSVLSSLFSALNAIAIPSYPAPTTVTVGPYTIANCTSENNDLIATSLQNLAKYLQPAIKDALASVQNPSPAFSTFFQDPASATFVSQVLTNITRGPSLFPKNSFSNGAPIFACLTAENQMTAQWSTAGGGLARDIYKDLCESVNPTEIVSLSGTPWIVACPTLFSGGPLTPKYASSIPLFATPASPLGGLQQSPNCPVLNVGNTLYTQDGTDFSLSMPWILLETLAHYYINGTFPLAADVNNINACVALPPQQSAANAHSFIYYAASIYNKCYLFPRTRSTVSQPGRNLLIAANPVASANPADAAFPVDHVNGQKSVQFGSYGGLQVTGATYYNQNPPTQKVNVTWPTLDSSIPAKE